MFRGDAVAHARKTIRTRVPQNPRNPLDLPDPPLGRIIGEGTQVSKGCRLKAQ